MNLNKKEEAKALLRLAIAQCKTDGCTGVPDFDLREVCQEHDYHYRHQDIPKRIADKKFRDGIMKKHPDSIFFTAIAWIYYIGVRVFGWIAWSKWKRKKKKGVN